MLELSQTISRALQDMDLDIDLMSETELQAAIQKRLRGGRVYFFGPLANSNGNLWKAFKQWLSKEKWWVGLLVVLVIGIPLPLNWSDWYWVAYYPSYGHYGMALFFSILCLCLSQGICFALVVGRSFKVRVVLTSIWLGPALIIGIPLGVYST